MSVIVLILLILAAVIGPGIWVRRVMKLYSEPADRYEKTGGETARDLLERLEISGVGVELAETGDHYDPEEKMVRLTEQNLRGRSLAAVTIAAHEVGHAHQDATGYTPLRMRTRLVKLVGPLEKTGALLLMASPLILGVTRVPAAGLLMVLGGLMTLGSAVLIHMLTLPTEFDASFKRALPFMKHFDILVHNDEYHARRLLRAAALTYVSASLMSLLSIARWWAILRR